MEKVDYKLKKPHEIGKIHAESVKKKLSRLKTIPDQDINWLVVWIRQEVTDAIKKEREWQRYWDLQRDLEKKAVLEE
jgi:hypothetical protein